jgi:hypothetical protein
MSSDGTKLAAVVNGGNIWRSTDSGETWTSTASTQQWRGITMSSDGTKLYATVDNGNIWTFREPFCYENSHVSNGDCVPCGPNLYRAQGDPIDGGDTECACVEDHRVLNGACVACDPGTSRAPGDVPSNGDTECLTCCEESFAKRGFAVGRAFALRSGRELR